VLGSRTCSVSAPTLVTVCCCVPGVVACAVLRLTCRGFTVRLGCVCSTIGIVNGLLLEQGCQVGDLVGDGIGRTGGWWRSFVEFADSIRSCEFTQYDGDAVVGVSVVVCVCSADGLESWTKLSTPCLAGG